MSNIRYSGHKTIFDKNKFEQIRDGEATIPTEDENLLYDYSNEIKEMKIKLEDLPPKISKWGFPYPKYNKKSCGIMLFKDSNPPTLLMVQKRCTYEFMDFVLGKYNPDSKPKLYGLFNKMTFHEKLDILSGDFRYLWYKAFLEDLCDIPEFNKEYYNHTPHSGFNIKVGLVKKPTIPMGTIHTLNIYRKYMNFVNTRQYKNTLVDVINNSQAGDPVWEIPKGRCDEGETHLGCAVRELQEETNISPKRYYIYTHMKPIYHTIEGYSTIYNTEYYMAMIKSDIPIKIQFKYTEQISELSKIQWMNLDQIHSLGNKSLHKLCKVAFKRFKKIKNKKYIQPLL